MHEQSLALHRELGNKAGIVHALSNLGKAHIKSGDYARACSCLCECLRLNRELGQQSDLADALDGFAALADAKRQWERAAWFYGAADTLRERLGIPLEAGPREERERVYARLRADPSAATFSAAFTAGRAAPLEQAIRMAVEENGGFIRTAPENPVRLRRDAWRHSLPPQKNLSKNRYSLAGGFRFQKV